MTLMTEAPPPAPDQTDCPTELARLNKIIRALMDRAERSTSAQASDFSLFQTTVILEDQVRARTAELEKALKENERINRALRESEARFRGLVSQSMVGIVIIEHGRFTYSNATFDEMFGYSADEIRQMGPVDIAIESDRTRIAENIRMRVAGEVDHVEYSFRGLLKDGGIREMEVYGSAADIGGAVLLISLVMDVTQRVQAERKVLALQEELRQESIHDSLTGLYNRRYLDEALGRELILAERESHPVSVIMGDLDHFKAVNDRFGHLAGDEILRFFGSLLKRHARSSDIFCRFGGEEFLLVLPGMAQECAVQRAEELRCALSATPVTFEGSPIAVTASFGVATFPHDGCNGDAVIGAADGALYAAKEGGRNRVNVS